MLQPIEDAFPVEERKFEMIDIIEFEENIPVLNEKQLKRVLLQPEIADLPVALYSIAGPCRKGKSFLLNLFVRYQEGQNLTDLDLATSDEIIDGPFKFQGGTIKPCTKGISIFEKPYYVSIKEFKKVAVFLMDTQGMFDHKKSTKDLGKLVGYSLLLSSYQFFNFQGGIDSLQLEAIGKVAEFASKIKNIDQAEIPFQAFMFIIRDWEILEDHALGLDSLRDQTSYLNELFQEDQEQAHQHVFTRQLLRETFDEMSCFFLPPPGDRIRSMGKAKTSCQWKDLSSDFLRMAQSLFEHLCHPDRVILKKVRNEIVTCRQLYNRALHFRDVMRCGLIDSPEGYLQIITMSRAATAIYSLCNRIDKSTDCWISSLRITPCILYSGHEYANVVRKNASLFDTYAKKDKIISSKTSAFIVEAGANADMENLILKCFNSYQSQMQNIPLQTEESSLNDFHREAEKAALKKFDDERKRAGDEIIQNHRTKLRSMIEDKFVVIKNEEKMKNIVAECFSYYEDNLLKWKGNNLEELQVEHERLKAKSLQQLRDHKEIEQAHLKAQENVLTWKIKHFYFKHKNRLNSEIILKEIIDEYTNAMTQGTPLKRDKALKNTRHQLVWKIIDDLKNKLPPHLHRQVFKEFQKATSEVYTDVKKRNLKWKIGAGVVGSILGGAGIAAAALIPPLLPAMIAAEYATIGLISGLLGAGAAAGGIVVGTPVTIANLVNSDNKYDTKLALLQPIFLALKVAFPDAVELLEEDVFITAMMNREPDAREEGAENQSAEDITPETSLLSPE